MTDSFSGSELSRSDFEGICMFGEGSFGVKALGGSASVMWLGCPKSKIVTELANAPIIGMGLSSFLIPGLGPIWGKVLDRAVEKTKVLPRSVFEQGSKAFMVFGGQGVGNQVTASLGGGYGIVELASASDQRTDIPMPSPPPDPPGPYQRWGREVYPLPSDFLFGFDHSDLDPSPRAIVALFEVAIRIKAKSSPARIEVHGYTDWIGSRGYNLALSKARAETIRRILLLFKLAEPYQITTKGFGTTNPVADNRTEQGRALNRRVEIVVY